MLVSLSGFSLTKRLSSIAILVILGALGLSSAHAVDDDTHNNNVIHNF